MMKLRRLGIGVVLLGTGVLAGAALFSTRVGPVYGAQGAPTEVHPTALLQIDPPQPGSIEGGGTVADSSTLRDLRTQMELLQSRKIIDAVVADRQIADLPSVKRQKDAARWLEQNIRIANVNDTSLLRIDLGADVGATNQEQAQLINAVANRFIQRSRIEQEEALALRQEWLQHDIAERSHRLQATRNELEKTSQELGGALGGRIPQQSLALHALELRRKQLELNLERAGAEALIERLKDKAGASQARLDERTRLEDRIAALRAQEKVLRTEMETIDRALGELGAGKADSLESMRYEIHGDVLAIEKLKERLQDLRGESARQERRIRVIDEAIAH